MGWGVIGGGGLIWQFDAQSQLEYHPLMAAVLGSNCLNPGSGGGGGKGGPFYLGSLMSNHSWSSIL